MRSAPAASDAMPTIQPPDEMQQASQEAGAPADAVPAPAASDVRGRTWSRGMPAMRVQRARWRLSGRPASAAEAEAREAAAAGGAGGGHSSGFSPSIRLIRAVVGVILLALTWAGALAIYLLAVATFAPLSRQRLGAVLPLRLVEGLGGCLMVILVATLLLVGAFALSLAVRPNDLHLPPVPPPHSSARDADEEQPGGG